MLSFSLVAEALRGLIYRRPSGKIPNSFLPGAYTHAWCLHVVNNQKSYATVVSQNSLRQPKSTQTFQFTAEQLTKFVANVAIQIAQPQVCYPNPKQDMLNLK